jgi:hypothetical protein
LAPGPDLQQQQQCYGVGHHTVFYCTISVTIQINTLYWEVTPDCLKYEWLKHFGVLSADTYALLIDKLHLLPLATRSVMTTSPNISLELYHICEILSYNARDCTEL